MPDQTTKAAGYLSQQPKLNAMLTMKPMNGATYLRAYYLEGEIPSSQSKIRPGSDRPETLTPLQWKSMAFAPTRQIGERG